MERQEKIDRLKEFVLGNYNDSVLIPTVCSDGNQYIFIEVENDKLKFIYQDGSIKYEDELTTEEIIII